MQKNANKQIKIKIEKQEPTESFGRMIGRMVVLSQSVEFAYTLGRSKREQAPYEAEKERGRRPIVIVGLWHVLAIHVSVFGGLHANMAYLYGLIVVLVARRILIVGHM